MDNQRTDTTTSAVHGRGGCGFTSLSRLLPTTSLYAPSYSNSCSQAELNSDSIPYIHQSTPNFSNQQKSQQRSSFSNRGGFVENKTIHSEDVNLDFSHINLGALDKNQFELLTQALQDSEFFINAGMFLYKIRQLIYSAVSELYNVVQ